MMFFLQLTEKTERVFNASSTLTPDSIMSDESQSRDWQMVEHVPSCSVGTSNVPDAPTENSSASGIRQFSSISAEATELSLHNSSNKCDYSGVTESLQLHDQCMLSGIDVSFTMSDLNVSADAELNDARLSAADADSSMNSTLKGSDVDEFRSKCDGPEIDSLQPTFSVAIPISSVLEMETKKDENVDVDGSAVKSSVREAYSPISDAGDEMSTCWTSVHSSAPVNNQSTIRPFSPISPFSPRPSASNTPLSVVPLNWSQYAAAAAACPMGVWSTDVSLGKSSGCEKSQPYHSHVVVSASSASQSSDLTFVHHSRMNGGNVVRPLEVGVPSAGNCPNVGFEQQHSDAISHCNYQLPESQYHGYTLPYNWYHSQSLQPCMQFANTVAGSGSSVSMQSLYYANSQVRDTAQLSSVEVVSQSVKSVRDTSSDSNRLHSNERLAHKVQDGSHLPPVTNYFHVEDGDRLQLRHQFTAANSSINNNGWIICLFVLISCG